MDVQKCCTAKMTDAKMAVGQHQIDHSYLMSNIGRFSIK